jgi:hypothetical protein
VGDILIAACKPHNLRSRTESVPQDSIEDVEVAVGYLSGPRRLGSGEFGEFLRSHEKPPPSSSGQPE